MGKNPLLYTLSHGTAVYPASSSSLGPSMVILVLDDEDNVVAPPEEGGGEPSHLVFSSCAADSRAGGPLDTTVRGAGECGSWCSLGAVDAVEARSSLEQEPRHSVSSSFVCGTSLLNAKSVRAPTPGPYPIST